MRLLGHAHKKHRFQLAEIYPSLPGQRMFYRQDHDRSVPGDAFPLEAPRGCRRTQPHKTQVDLSRFQGAKLFRRRHVEEVQRDVREGLAEGPERFREQLEVKVGRIRDVQLAGFAPAETLYRLDTFRGQRQYASGINEEGPPFLGQGHLAFGTVQEPYADLPLQV